MNLIAGVDEAGRGCIAGPVVAAAVILGKEKILGLDDSKKISDHKRIKISEEIKVKSKFGKELDSLADIVSFGLVPGFLIYKLYIMSGIQENFFLFFDFKISYIALFGFLVTVSTMIRLTKFNLSNSQVFSFEGFPSPANAVFIVSLPIFPGLKEESVDFIVSNLKKITS